MSDPKFEFVSPVFHRDAGQPKPACPLEAKEFPSLRKMKATELRELGFGMWNDPKKPDPEDEEHFGGRVLCLFPGEWFKHIPKGFEVVCITGERESFDPDTADDDIRFGMLPYGILADP